MTEGKGKDGAQLAKPCGMISSEFTTTARLGAIKGIRVSRLGGDMLPHNEGSRYG